MQCRHMEMNAAMEGEGAGTAVRSFGAVAAEVRSLAASVSSATEEIERVVAGNNQLAREVLRGIETSLANTGQGVLLMREAGEVIASIQKDSERVESAVRDVARAAHSE